MKETEISFSWPFSNYYPITSHYGVRKHPVHGDQRFHDGIDIGAPSGTKIYAVADGKVIKANWNGGYGNYVEIEHENNVISFYGHLSSISVKSGFNIKKGDLLGYVGSTGVSTGAHLHFGVHLKGNRNDPLRGYFDSTVTDTIYKKTKEYGKNSKYPNGGIVSFG